MVGAGNSGTGGDSVADGNDVVVLVWVGEAVGVGVIGVGVGAGVGVGVGTDAVTVTDTGELSPPSIVPSPLHAVLKYTVEFCVKDEL